MAGGDSDELQKILESCPLLLVQMEKLRPRAGKGPAQVGLGRVGTSRQCYQGEMQGLGAGKEAAEGGVPGTGGREGEREEGGKPLHLPLPAAGRRAERAGDSCLLRKVS